MFRRPRNFSKLAMVVLLVSALSGNYCLGAPDSAKKPAPLVPCQKSVGDLSASPILSQETEPAYRAIRYTLLQEGKPDLALRSSINRDGDPIEYVQRKEGDDPKITASEAERLVGEVLQRYYLSFTVKDSLLPGRVDSHKLSNGAEEIAKLLSYDKISDPNFPRVLPLNSNHEDYHFARADIEVRNKTQHSYGQDSFTPDIPNAKINSGIYYKFQGHGDSHRFRESYIGRRIELITEYETGENSPIVYEKARFDKAGVIVARTLVVKSDSRTLRLRLDPQSRGIDHPSVSHLLAKEFNIEGTPRKKATYLKSRYALHLVLNVGSEVTHIGRMFFDINVHLESHVESDIFNRVDVPNHVFLNVTEHMLFGDVSGNLQLTFMESKTSNNVTSSSTSLSVEYLPQYEIQVKKLLDDMESVSIIR